jgi:two-component system, NarL family, sensor histidine kinase BarA
MSSNAAGPPPEWDKNLHDLTLGSRLKLDDLVDREALGEMTRSFQALFGISLRIFNADGVLLAEAGAEQAICRHIGALPKGQIACRRTVEAARRAEVPASGEVGHACFTGAQYRIFAITYDDRKLGKAVLGPYLPAEVITVPSSLLEVDPGVDATEARLLLPRMPRARAETVTLISDHLKRTLDLILFSGHKMLLTTQMHLSSVRESYRELQDKNKKLQDAYDRLKELDRLKSDFLGTVSHELRTPLTSIIGYSEMLVEGLAGPMVGEQHDFVKIIHDKGRQLLELIMSLLDLSKLESGTMRLRKGAFAAGELIDEVIDTFAPKALRRGIALERQVAPELPLVQGDKERIRQVVGNLCDNAIKFSPEGATVTLSAAMALPGDADQESGFALLGPTRRMLEIRVIDEGIGIPDAERERIFDPFYQVDSGSTREYEGTGLGLSIVKRLVDAHGGRVTALANTPRGSIFSVLLPAEPHKTLR